MGGLEGLHTGVAQLVEHRSPKPSVVRSSRTSRANKKKFLLRYEKNNQLL